MICFPKRLIRDAGRRSQAAGALDKLKGLCIWRRDALNGNRLKLRGVVRRAEEEKLHLPVLRFDGEITSRFLCVT